MVENTKRYPRIIPRPNGNGIGFQTMPIVLGDVGVPVMSCGGKSGPRNKNNVFSINFEVTITFLEI